MTIRYPDQRVGVFVDVQNLYYSARHMYNSRVNFGEILKEAVGDRKLIRAIAYVVEANMPEEQSFFEALAKAGYEVKKKELQTFAGGQQKADWDVGMAMDIVKLMPKLDVVVLCSGDADFAPLLEYLQMSGQLTETISFGKSTGRKIKELTDNFIDLDTDPSKFLLHTKPVAKKAVGKKSAAKSTSPTASNDPKDKSFFKSIFDY